MTLNNKYTFGCLVQFYELEMLKEHVDSCLQMLHGIDNPGNVTFWFVFSHQEHFEKSSNSFNVNVSKFDDQIGRLLAAKANVVCTYKGNGDDFYNIARFRRDLIYDWCERTDFIMFSETDSLWPNRTLQIIEYLWSTVKDTTPKFLLTFGYRLNWDESWSKLVHPYFDGVKYVDNDDFVLYNEASEKAYMSLDRMNEINEGVQIDEIEIVPFVDPKADGSCLVMSADLAMSIGGMPHALLHCGEDEAIVRQCKMVMGSNMVQYHVRNQLRVHNRRHPFKRVNILSENNPRGFCDDRKGSWWFELENASKYNLENIKKQVRFIRIDDILKKFT